MVTFADFGVERVKQFQTSPQAEAQGAVMMTWLNNQLADQTRPRLQERGITDLDAEAWYKFQTFLDIMREIVETGEGMTPTLVAVGKGVVANLPLDKFATMDDFKGFVLALHHTTTRNTPDTENIFIHEADGHLYMLNNTPVSNDILYGFFWELLRKAKIGGKRYTLAPHEDYPSAEVGSIFQVKLLNPKAFG